jgi:hypothetical protein
MALPDPRPTRRRLLTATGSLTVTGILGGCTLLGGPQAISEVTLKPEKLVIQLSPDVDVTALTLIGPDGTPVEAARLMPGTTTVTFKLTGSEPPGKYQLVASNGNETIDERRLTLTKTMELIDVKTVRRGNQRKEGLLLTLKATGDLPLKIDEETFSVKGAPRWGDNEFHRPFVTFPDSQSNGLFIPAGSIQQYILGFILIHRPDRSVARPQPRCSGMTYTLMVRCFFGEAVTYSYEISLKDKGEAYVGIAGDENNYSCTKTIVTNVAQVSTTESS